MMQDRNNSDVPVPSNLNYLQVENPLHKKNLGSSVRNIVGKVMKARTASLKHLAHEDKEFYSVFNTDKTNRRLTVLNEISAEEKRKKIDFSTLPQMNDKEVIEFTSKELVGRVIQSKYFRYTIMTLIFVTFILTAVETNKGWERQYHVVFEALDQIITTIFLCEVLLKWFHGFRKFWYNGFNILDFFIVFSLLIGPMVLSSSSNKIIRILRVLRVFRSLREINSIPRLQVIVQAILQSVPDMANIVVLLVIFMLVFSVLGINLFGETIASFRDLSTAMFSLFICITQDGWVDILQEFKDRGAGLDYVIGSLYLIIFIIMGAFIFTNLIVAVVVTNLEYAVKDVKKEETMHAKELEMQLQNENEEGDQEIGTNTGDNIPSKIFEKQDALNIPDLSGLDIRCIENYFLIVAAMEENMCAYKELLKDLRSILNQACELNKSAAMEGVVQGDGNRDSNRRKSIAEIQQVISLNRDIGNKYKRKRSDGGDMLSSLMSMEECDWVNSSTKNNLSSVVAEVADTQMMRKLSTIDNDVQQRYFRRRSTSMSMDKRNRDRAKSAAAAEDVEKNRVMYRKRRSTLLGRNSESE